MAMNKFADLTEEEFAATFNTLFVPDMSIVETANNIRKKVKL